MTAPAADATQTPDLVLELRLDALLKNFKQIQGSRAAVDERSKEVLGLRDLARGEEASVDDALSDLATEIRNARNRVGDFRGGVRPERLDLALADIDRVAEGINGVRGNFARMLSIIDEMARRWEQIADDRLDTLEDTLVHESTMRITKTEGYQGRLRDASTARDAIWDEYEDLAYRDGVRLFGEYVDFMGGIALRNTGIDHGVCQMADDLVGRLYRIGATKLFHSMTLPTRRVASSKTIARIIRMGFPEWTVWAVPLGAHEFGHVVLDDNDDIKVALSEETDALAASGRDTYLADAFATCVMGPAYAYAAVLLSLDPCREDRDSRTAARKCGKELSCTAASPDSARVYVILRTLELLAERTDDYEGVRGMLEDAWSGTLRAFALDFDLGDQAKHLDTCADFMFGFLSQRASHVLYKARRYAELGQWPSLLTASASEGDPMADVRGEMGVRDVLNMAWRERMANEESWTGERPDRLAEAALEVWRGVLVAGSAAARPWSQPLRGGPR